MNSGSGNGERLSASPQPESANAIPVMIMEEIAGRRISLSYPDCDSAALENRVYAPYQVRNEVTGF
jgi:hypothetical protein